MLLICLSGLYILLRYILTWLTVLKQEHVMHSSKKKKKLHRKWHPFVAVLYGPLVNFMQHFFYGLFGRGPYQFGCLLRVYCVVFKIVGHLYFTMQTIQLLVNSGKMYWLSLQVFFLPCRLIS